MQGDIWPPIKPTAWEKVCFWARLIPYLAVNVSRAMWRQHRAEMRAHATLQTRGRAVVYDMRDRSFMRLIHWKRVERALEVARDETNDPMVRRRCMENALDLWIRHNFSIRLFTNYPRHEVFVRAVWMYRVMLLESRRNGGPFLLAYAENGAPLPV